MMTVDMAVLESLEKNADRAAEFESLVKAASEKPHTEQVAVRQIDASGMMGLTPLNPDLKELRYRYGL